VDPRIDVHFAVKIKTFSNPDLRPRKPPKFHFWGLENVCSISPLTLAVSEVKTLYSSSQSMCVNRKIRVGISKQIVVSDPLPTGYVARSMCM